MSVGSSFKDMGEMSHIYGGDGNGGQSLLEEGVDRLMTYTGIEEVLEFREDLLQIGSQLYFQASTLLNDILPEPVKFYEFDIVQNL